jgi:phenylacetate-coenzyme A ligase PaaK-like adenylate-forming protein
LAPRFELLGRFGDIFKFATNYVNYQNIKAIFAKEIGYTGWLQIVLSYNTKDSMEIRVEDNFSVSEAETLSVLKAHSPEVAETLDDNTGSIRIIKQSKDTFELSTGGGKVRSVIDLRK